ncbi:unnamed protein product [Mytilus coruscus]|uniref:Uncharacterized protein n=1 Tax=Mytilus coruscus TaxID=42192 RepID=A0A6J8D5V1_MYTCO|nr:unnamed protein product [Mytilus coruscus]
MIDVFSTLILNVIVYRYANGDQLNLLVSAGQSKWKEAFDSCNDPTYWHQLFDDCQSESCNASSIADKIINKPRLGKQQYWIYGYVLRSPVIVNIGCFSLNASLKNNFHNGSFSFEQNSAFECSIACTDDKVDYIFLKESECLCIPKAKFRYQVNDYREENTGACKKPCDGNSRDLCGATSSIDGEELYSVYQVITRNRISSKTFGDTCAVIHWNGGNRNRFNFTTCTASQMYICERYDMSSQSYKESCQNKTTSWFTARQNCQEQDLQLRPYTTSSFASKCRLGDQVFWLGNHIFERIVWANDSLPENALCLKLVLTKSGFRFDTENCSATLYSLCYEQQHTSSEKNDQSFTSLIHSSLVPIVAGSVGGFAAIMIVLITVILIKRRTNSKHKNMNTTTDQRQLDTHLKQIKNTIPEESRKLVNVTEEGIYNHLGDSEKMIEIEMKQQDSSIYDVMGDDEYHVFTASGKRQKFKDDDDLCDHGAASDVYNTLDDTVTTNRPESDTYNVK